MVLKHQISLSPTPALTYLTAFPVAIYIWWSNYSAKSQQRCWKLERKLRHWHSSPWYTQSGWFCCINVGILLPCSGLCVPISKDILNYSDVCYTLTSYSTISTHNSKHQSPWAYNYVTFKSIIRKLYTFCV